MVKAKILFTDTKRYNGTVEQLRNCGLIKVKAAKLINDLTKSAVKISAEDLEDGEFVNIVLNYWREQWKQNPTFKNVRFDKYLFDWLEIDTTELLTLETRYTALSNSMISFFVKDDPFYSWAEWSDKVNFKKAPKQVHFKFKDLVDIKGNSVKVNLSKDYFTVTASSEQINKVKAIELFVKTFRENFKIIEPELPYTDIKDATCSKLTKLMKPYVKKISMNLEDIEFDYYRIKQIQ